MGTILDPSEVILEMGLGAAITAEETGIIAQAIEKAEGAVKRYLNYDPSQAVRTEYYPVRDMGCGGDRYSVWESDGTEAYLRRRTGAAVNMLQVKHLPIRFTDSSAANPIDLRIDFDGRFGTQAGSFAASQQKVEGTDFWPEYDGVDSNGIAMSRNGVLRSIGRWPTEPGSVKLVYVGGYTPAELRGHDNDTVVDASPIWSSVLDEVKRRVLKSYTQRKLTGVGFGAGLLSERLGDYSYQLDSGMLMNLVGATWDLTPETRQALDSFVNYGVALAS